MKRISKMSGIWVWVFFAFLAGCTLKKDAAQSVRNENIETEEYQVYSALLNMSLSGQGTISSGKPDIMLVISRQTVTPPSEHCSVSTLIDSKDIRLPSDININDINEMATDWLNKNKTALSFERKLDLNAEYLLIDGIEIEAIMNGDRKPDKSWEAFHKKFPGARGYQSLSRVGFNLSKTRALVYQEFQCGYMCAEGAYILLAKQDRVWKTAGSLCEWIS